MADSTGNQEFVPLATPQRARRLVASTFKLYRRYPWLFLAFAACVIVPYDLLTLLVTGGGRLSHGGAGFGVQLSLTFLDTALVGPLISALHVHAAADVREGNAPEMGPVARRGLKALPVVAVAVVASSIGTFVGFLLFIVPGVILLLRWAVVAQAAATEGTGWSAALRRSRQLTAGHYRHIVVFFILVTLVLAVPSGVSIALNHHHGVGPFVIRLVIHIVTASFSALATALLFYDLLVRREAEDREAAAWAAAAAEAHASVHGAEATGASIPLPPDPSRDPRRYTDQNRPHGWYVNPSSPKSMRYWRTSRPRGWESKTRTPPEVRQLWRDP